MTYRNDIDGLRALAVLAVVIFHVGVTQLSGGYLGVDVFFTISGFLITSILLRDISTEKFAFKRFYIRRVRRLIPALLVTIICTWVVGLFILTPDHFKHLSQSALAAAFSVSNIFFWMDAGYFSDAALNKPLLHTWSLSVEEQFYLIWPALLFVLVGLTKARKSKVLLWGVMIILSALSIIFAEWSLKYNPSAVFYLTPFRIAEFGIGALCIPFLARFKNSKLVSTLIFWTGILALLICFILFDSQTQFPGVNSLIPAFATAAVILGGQKATGTFILSNAISVWFGKISYSLYLVHWPVVVFYRYGMSNVLGQKDIAAMFLISLTLAVLLYYGIERVFRDTRKLESRRDYKGKKTAGLIVFLSAAIAVSLYGWLGNGLSWRLPPDVQKYASTKEEVRRELLNGGLGCETTLCEMGADSSPYERLFFIGDSHMHHYFYGFDKKLKTLNLQGLMVQEGACPFFTNDIYGRESLKDRCTSDRKRLWGLADQSPKSPIILSQNWVLYNDMLTPERNNREFPVESDKYGSLELYIGREIEKFIKRAGNRNVVLIGPSPQTILNDSVITCLLKPNLFERVLKKPKNKSNDACMSMSNTTRNFEDARNINAIFKSLSDKYANVENLNPFEAFCDDGICIGATEDTIYYRDNSHLSVSGAKRFIAVFDEKITKVFQSSRKGPDSSVSQEIVFEGSDKWFAQAKATIEKNSNNMRVTFPDDGRATLQQELTEPYPGPFRLRLRAQMKAPDTLGNAKMRVVLQRGCDPIPLEGQSFDYSIDKDITNIDSEMIVLEAAECVMVRIWNGPDPISAEISGISVELSPL